MYIRSTLPLLLILFLVASGDSVAQDTGGTGTVVEPVFDGARPTYGEFVGTVAMKSFPDGIGFAIVLPDSAEVINYRFFLQQEAPLTSLSEVWQDAKVIFNRDALLIQDQEGTDLVFVVLPNVEERVRDHGTINHDEVQATARFDGYGLAYYPARESTLTLTDFLAGTW